MEFDLMECEDNLLTAEKLCDLSVEARNWEIHRRDVKLSKWYRKWYIVGPLGAGIGLLIGILAGG
jgi:hypothetical protein